MRRIFILCYLLPLFGISQDIKSTNVINGTWYYIDSTCKVCDTKSKANYNEIFFSDTVFVNYSICSSNSFFQGRYLLLGDSIKFIDKGETYMNSHFNFPFTLQKITCVSGNCGSSTFHIKFINDSNIQITTQCKLDSEYYIINLFRVKTRHKVKFKNCGYQGIYANDKSYKKFIDRAKRRGAERLSGRH